MSRTAIVIGCGGTIGSAWAIAALLALAEQTGIDPRNADVLQGTSSGAELVTLLAGGVGVDELVDMQRGRAHDRRLREHIASTPASRPPMPRPPLLNSGLQRTHSGLAAFTVMAPTGRGDMGWLQRLAEGFEVGAWLPHPAARMVAYDILARERVVFGAPGAPFATVSEALRASWATPGWMTPVPIGNRIFVDGGISSTASVDLLSPEDADRIYVIAPMASAPGVRVPGTGGVVEHRLLRRPMSAGLAAEIEAVRARGTTVVPILPTATDLAGLGAHFMSRSHRAAAFESAMTTAPTTVRDALAG
ncbi:patatin-like phospholipase family protein [Rhodococcus sp. IEGM 1408]|uniref:patatin-like phospholipase family protein n=1 Tax=Rhodococcus sp. IEGM 1408 TaxID=3082220 RepID=UPI002954CC23|nr:patatin-like phospholipase family protein [Rhodococcus sp. IEGM 1408]MDV7999925.1 patatin-like phospholipase family protein [Rhodococcus sp. IEGM 1408]